MSELPAGSAPPPVPPPLAVAAVLLFSAAPEALARFYREKLGLPLARVRVEGRPLHWGCDVGHVYVSIWPDERSQARRRGGHRGGLALWVRDVQRTFDRLVQEGVEVGFPPQRSALGLIARLLDPDGNPFELYQPPPRG